MGGNNQSKVDCQVYLTLEQCTILTNFTAVNHQVYKNTTARRVFSDIMKYNYLIIGDSETTRKLICSSKSILQMMIKF